MIRNKIGYIFLKDLYFNDGWMELKIVIRIKFLIVSCDVKYLELVLDLMLFSSMYFVYFF